MKKFFFITSCIFSLQFITSYSFEFEIKEKQEKSVLNETQSGKFKEWYNGNVKNLTEDQKKEFILKLKTIITLLSKLNSDLETIKPADFEKRMTDFEKSNKENAEQGSEVVKKGINSIDDLMKNCFPAANKCIEEFGQKVGLISIGAGFSSASEDNYNSLLLSIQKEMLKEVYPTTLACYTACLKLCEQ